MYAIRSYYENTSEYYQFAYFKQGIIYAFTAQPLSEEQHQLILRFATAFELTYTRFLDLQKAEAQARESQIQLSLERVRARSLAMKSSDELHEVLSVLFRQFDDLGIRITSYNVCYTKLLRAFPVLKEPFS